MHRYFDSHGNYYLREDPESVQDEWLQEVDWNKVHCHQRTDSSVSTHSSSLLYRSKSRGSGKKLEGQKLMEMKMVVKKKLLWTVLSSINKFSKSLSPERQLSR